MEYTYEEAVRMMEERFQEFPELGAIAHSPSFDDELEKMLVFLEIDTTLLPTIKHEILVMLSLYAPLGRLAAHISESTKLPLEKCEMLVTMIDAVLLKSLSEELTAFSEYWESELRNADATPEVTSPLKERLDLRPQMSQAAEAPQKEEEKPEPSARPLTREELLSALAAKRTMASDMAAAQERNKVPETPAPPPPEKQPDDR